MDDLDALKAAAIRSAGAIAETLLGPRNRAASGRDRWHFGRGNGSLWVHLSGERAGLWHDGAIGKGGDMIALVQHVRGCSFLDAVAWLRDFQGEGRAEAQPVLKRPAPAPQPRRDDDAEAREAAALAIWHEAREGIGGTPGERHMRLRGIDPARLPPNTGMGWPATLRWHAGLDAIVVAVNDAQHGMVRAVQTIALHPDGSPRRRANGSKIKITHGPVSGRAVRFGWHHDPAGRWGLAEGVATALAAAQLLGHPVWAALGAGNMQNVEPPGWATTAIVVADHDEAGLRAAAEAVARLRDRMPAQIIRASRPGADAADLVGAPA